MQVMEIVPVFGERSAAEEPAPPGGDQRTGVQQEEHAPQAASDVIFITGPGKTATLTLMPDETVSDLVERVSRKFGLASETGRLVSSTSPLQRSATLAACNVRKGSTLKLVPCLGAGGGECLKDCRGATHADDELTVAVAGGAKEPVPPGGDENTAVQQEEHTPQASEAPRNLGDPTAESGEASPQEEARSASASNPYKDLTALFNLLRSRCILLLRGTWLLKRAGFKFIRHEGYATGEWRQSSEPRPLPRRQELEAQGPEAYMTVEEIEAMIEVAKQQKFGDALVKFAVPILGLSYCWEGPDAPDPQGRVLQALSQIIVDHTSAACREDFLGFGAPDCFNDGYADVAVFIDFPSVHQKPRVDTEEESFKSALKGMNVVYAHELTYCAILRGQDDHLAVPRDERGWPVFEELMSNLLKETSVGFLGGRSKVLSNEGEQESPQRPPLPSEEFDVLLNNLKFTSGADMAMVSKLYRTALADAMKGRTCLQYKKLPWADKELATLGRCLAEAGAREIEEVNLESLDVQFSEPGCEPFFDVLASSTRLRSLEIRDCPNVKEIPGLSGLVSLTALEVNDCIQLKEMPDLSRLSSLKELTLTFCNQLKEIRDLSGLVSLKELKVTLCNSLKEIPDLSGLVSLKKLGVIDCNSLKEIPDLSGLVSLTALEVKDCIQLKEISGSFDKLASLETLELEGCHALEEMPDLSGLASLKQLSVSFCRQLKEIHVGNMDSLEKLELFECRKLRKVLPQSRGVLPNLKEIEVKYCGQLSLRVEPFASILERPDLTMDLDRRPDPEEAQRPACCCTVS